MEWVYGEYSKVIGKDTPAVVTGKPIEFGGSLGREAATGQGGAYTLDELTRKLDKIPQKIRVAIQGFGNVGYFAAERLIKLGFNVIAVSDSQGGIISKATLLPKHVLIHKRKTGSVIGYKDTKVVTNEEFLEQEVDVLIPAALEDQIIAENADRIKAKIILELANGPTTPEADEVLKNKGIIVVPDILANAGGVTVSAYEWMQNLKAEKWTEEKVNTKLKKAMIESFKGVWEKKEKYQTDLRMAAYILAIERLEEAIKSRGI